MGGAAGLGSGRVVLPAEMIDPSLPLHNIQMKFALLVGLMLVGEVSNRDIVETVLNLKTDDPSPTTRDQMETQDSKETKESIPGDRRTSTGEVQPDGPFPGDPGTQTQHVMEDLPQTLEVEADLNHFIP